MCIRDRFEGEGVAGFVIVSPVDQPVLAHDDALRLRMVAADFLQLQAEIEGETTSRLALVEEAKCLPFGEVWNEFCRRQDVPPGFEWMDAVKIHEAKVTARRL